MYLYVYLVMNIILFFHLVNGVQLLYRLLKVVLQGGEEVSVSGSEHSKRWIQAVSKKQNKTMWFPLTQRAHLQASKLSGFWFQRAVRPALPKLTLFSASSFKTTSPSFLFFLLLLPPSPILATLVPPLSSSFLERLGHPSFFHLKVVNGTFEPSLLSRVS